MGITRETTNTDCWTHKWGENPDRVQQAMGLDRCEDLSRFLHISDPPVQGPAHFKILKRRWYARKSPAKNLFINTSFAYVRPSSYPSQEMLDTWI